MVEAVKVVHATIDAAAAVVVVAAVEVAAAVVDVFSVRMHLLSHLILRLILHL